MGFPFSAGFQCLVRPPCSVNNGREQSHDSHSTEDEQDLQKGVSRKKKVLRILKKYAEQVETYPTNTHIYMCSNPAAGFMVF